MKHIKFIGVKQARDIHQYKNVKQELFKFGSLMHQLEYNKKQSIICRVAMPLYGTHYFFYFLLSFRPLYFSQLHFHLLQFISVPVLVGW